MSKHTPGRGPTGQTPTLIKTQNTCVTEDLLANAHLIAAAPELLSAARSALTMIQDEGWSDTLAVVIELQAAIAKAEGK